MSSWAVFPIFEVGKVSQKTFFELHWGLRFRNFCLQTSIFLQQFKATLQQAFPLSQKSIKTHSEACLALTEQFHVVTCKTSFHESWTCLKRMLYKRLTLLTSETLCSKKQFRIGEMGKIPKEIWKMSVFLFELKSEAFTEQ